MTKQKHAKAVDAASNAEELLPLEQMMSQGSAPNEGTAHAVDDINQVNDSEHQGAEDEGAALVPELRFAGFMEPWRLIHLKDAVTSFEYGLNATAKPFDYRNKFLRITDIEEDSRSFSLSNLVSPNVDNETADQYVAQYGDLFFARVGSVGRTYLYSPNDGHVIFIGNLICGHILQKVFSPEFVFYNTLTKGFISFVGSVSARSVQQRINAREYGTYQFAVPSIAEQQRIGSLFKELDHNIELNRGLLEKLTQLKKSMLEQMFPREGESVPRLRFAGFTEPWVPVLAEELGSWCSGKTPSRSNTEYWKQGTIHWLKTGEINDSVVSCVEEKISLKAVEELHLRVNPVGTVVIAMYGDGTIAKVGVLNIPCTTNQACCACIVDPFCADNWFVFMSLFKARDRLLKNTAGSAQPNLSKERILSTLLLMPSLAEQQRIGEFFKALDQRITQQRAKLEKLGQLKKALLEQMFV